MVFDRNHRTRGALRAVLAVLPLVLACAEDHAQPPTPQDAGLQDGDEDAAEPDEADTGPPHGEHEDAAEPPLTANDATLAADAVAAPDARADAAEPPVSDADAAPSWPGATTLETTLELAAKSPDCLVEKLPDAQHYAEFFELCVPDRPEALTEVQAILAPLADHFEFGMGSRGLIGCDTTSEYLFYDLPLDLPVSVLCALTQLPYVERIAASFFP